ncbi:pyridoxamine 5'-phosphate oxidase family protein [Actinoallomurus soli]|uniref:pyridoxamine 5'-phosphate oxidase family protein n=1 Tax=Actinoallomurus soli TaxID=2952535 RepID=UPI002092716C|nr:FAD-binding oxidoreductase [Actinoallomurus soli]
MKQLDRLDDGCSTVIAHSPIAGFGYVDVAGRRQATFIGGAAGFVRVESPARLWVPFRADTPEEQPADGWGISLVFLLPGVGETLRLNGALTAREDTGLTVQVHEAYVHCARSILRSRLWQPALSSPQPPAAPPGGEGPLHQLDVARFLSLSPFLVLSTGDAAGAGDTSPRGDRPGFARALDGRTLVIPDRKGNQRADTFHNLLQDQRIALAALVPGRDEVLHLHGTAQITTDPRLLETMALRGRPPQAALIIDVHDAAVTGSQAVEQARLWDPEADVDHGAVPDLIALATQHAIANPTNVAGTPPALLMKPLAVFPRFTRWAMNLGYRTALSKEGYDDQTSHSGPLRRLRRLLAPLLRHGTTAEAPARGMNRATRRMRITSLHRETASALTITMEDAEDPSSPISFRPGQYFTLITDIGGRTVRRAYSASSAPGSPRLQVTIKRVTDGLFSGHVHENLRAGDTLEILGPSGSFGIDTEATDEELIMIAIGSGITPMMSVIRTALAGQAPARLALLYGNRTQNEIIFAEELDRLQRQHPGRLTVTHRLTRPTPEWTGARGRLDAHAIRHWLDQLTPDANARYLLCGPAPVTHIARAALRDLAVPDDQIHTESYNSATTDSAAPATGPHQMSVHRDGHLIGTVLIEPGQTLLNGGLDAGLPMPYSCTIGNCGECMAELLTGQTVMSEPNCLTRQQQAEGHILPCVSHPTSDVHIDITEE